MNTPSEMLRNKCTPILSTTHLSTYGTHYYFNQQSRHGGTYKQAFDSGEDLELAEGN